MRLFLIVSCLFTVIILQSCGTTEVQGPISIADPYALSNLTGKVVFQTAAGGAVSTRPNATVLIDSTNFSAVADSKGIWAINDFPAGKYTLTFSSPGYGSTKLFGKAIPTYIPTLVDQNLGQIPSTHAQLDSLAIGVFYLDSTLDVFASTSAKTFAIYVSEDSTFSDLNKNVYSLNVLPSSDTTSVLIDLSDLRAAGIPRNATAYVAVFDLAGVGDLSTYVSAYLDPRVGRAIYTARGPRSNMMTIKLP